MLAIVGVSQVLDVRDALCWIRERPTRPNCPACGQLIVHRQFGEGVRGILAACWSSSFSCNALNVSLSFIQGAPRWNNGTSTPDFFCMKIFHVFAKLQPLPPYLGITPRCIPEFASACTSVRSGIGHALLEKDCPTVGPVLRVHLSCPKSSFQPGHGSSIPLPKSLTASD
jgi:hypothetical protein